MRRTAPRLSSDEVALVLRRAADLEGEAECPAAPGGVEPAAVEEAAREVGLSPDAVRQALAELHAGALGPSGRSGLAGRSPVGVAAHMAVEARLVVAEAETVHATTADFLRREAFGLRRHHAGQAVYHRRTDVGARVRRLVHAGGSMQLSGVRTVTVAVTALDTPATPATPGAPGTPSVPAGPVATGDGRAGDARGSGPQHLVRVEAEVASARLGDRLRAAAAAVAAGTTLAVAGLLAGMGLLAVAGGVAGGVAVRLWLGRRLRRRRRDEVRDVLAALLDAVEDPSSRDRLVAGQPAWLHWSSSGSALSRGSWRSARGWARTSWSVRHERSPDTSPSTHPADRRAGPRHT